MEGKQVGHGTGCRRILSEIIGVTSNGSQVSIFFEKIYGLDYIFILGLSSHVKQRVVVIVILVELLQITDRNIKIVKKACLISLGHL